MVKYWSLEIVEKGQNICHALSCKQAEQYQTPILSLCTFSLLESIGSS